MSVMNSAVLGMSAQTNWLSTIAQNVANSSTTGYKDAETEFSALVDQVGAGNAPGLGVTTSSITLASLQGSIVATSTPTDLAIQGGGFFVVSDSAGDTFLTRDGSFVPDASGNLVNAGGYYLMGASVQNGGSASSFSDLQKVNVDQAGSQGTPTTAGTLSVNLPSTAAIVPTALTPAGGGSTYTDETSLVAYDSAGAPVTLNVYMTRVGDSAPGTPTWDVSVYNAADAGSGGGFPYSGPALASQTVTFSPTSGLATSGASLGVPIPGGQTMTLNLGASTQLAGAFVVNGATANGAAPAAVTGVNVGAYGTLSFIYSNGTTLPAYAIPLGAVASPDSLTAVDGTVFSPNANSGPVEFGAAGTPGFGTISSSALESSTVDLGAQLTSMIQAQSSYQFNSQVFQTGSTIISDLNQLGEQ
jgi:flagellar hook protein FlgE